MHLYRKDLIFGFTIFYPYDIFIPSRLPCVKTFFTFRQT